MMIKANTSRAFARAFAATRFGRRKPFTVAEIVDALEALDELSSQIQCSYADPWGSALFAWERSRRARACKILKVLKQ